MQTPELEGWWCWLPITSPPTNQKNSHELTTPCSLNTIKTLTTHIAGVGGSGDTVLRALSCCWSPLAGKPIKLFFSTSPKTLSLWFSSVPVCTGQVWATEATIKVKSRELPLFFSGLRTWHSLWEDVGSIPGLAQWVKGSNSTPSPGNLARCNLCCRCDGKKKKRKKIVKSSKISFNNILTQHISKCYHFNMWLIKRCSWDSSLFFF